MAKELSVKYKLSHLDLDTLAWLPTSPPRRKSPCESEKEIVKFIKRNTGWIVEGCYSDLLEIAMRESDKIIYMNLSIEKCISNAKKRPWEPHKYTSKEAQDANLEMLINWISQYTERSDDFSKKSHEALYEQYKGLKEMITSNRDF